MSLSFFHYHSLGGLKIRMKFQSDLRVVIRASAGIRDTDLRIESSLAHTST